MYRCGQNHLDEDILLWFSGGIEPIPEVSGDGEDLSQEATKFIKKKQSVKKVRKGRNTNTRVEMHYLVNCCSPTATESSTKQ